jgi:hypothetical protein
VCHKNPIKDPWLEPSKGRQKGKAKERPKITQPARSKKKERELISLVVGSYVT